MDETVIGLVVEQFKNEKLDKLLTLRATNTIFRNAVSHILKARAHMYGLKISSDANIIIQLKRWDTLTCYDFETIVSLLDDPVYSYVAASILMWVAPYENDLYSILYKIVINHIEDDRHPVLYYIPNDSVLIACNILYRYYSDNGGTIAEIGVKVTQAGRPIKYYDATIRAYDKEELTDPSNFDKITMCGQELYIPKNIGDLCIIQGFFDRYIQKLDEPDELDEQDEQDEQDEDI